jgi:hypothetical protein
MVNAVITGDIKESSKIKTEHRAWLSKSLKEILDVWDNDFSMKSELYRGDSFQCLLKDPINALKVCLLIKTFIKCLNPIEDSTLYKRQRTQTYDNVKHEENIFDSRIAIGIGEVNLEMETLATSDGEAFQISGRLLDEIKHTKRMIAIGTSDLFHDELETELILLDNIISRATPFQCEVINFKLLGRKEINIANILNIQQSAVNQRSNSGSWHAIDAMIKRFENIYG